MRLLNILWHYWRTKRRKFTTRNELIEYQQRQLERFRHKILRQSPYFRKYLTLAWSQWPMMDKRLMMANFDLMNTANLSSKKLLHCAQQSELSKDFTSKVGKFSVGLSSGTSGQRGLFVVSPKEQQIWAGAILAKLLPKGLFAKERVALFLRADNHLYHSVNSRWLSLRFFGLFNNFQQQLTDLASYQPTIIVAPAQVLSALAKEKLAGKLTINPDKVISAAEVLESQDRQLLNQVFNEVGEVYQATEGFLGSTCALGTLHLNEEFIHIEPQWLDERRFMPIITDFTRTTQPIVRYRLDDILVVKKEPCGCGNPTMAIAHIEGRHDDQILLQDRHGNNLTIFADYCSRIIANTLPLTSDYRLIQTSQNNLQLIGCCDQADLVLCQNKLCQHFAAQGADCTLLNWQLTAVDNLPPDLTLKRRRIIRERWTV